MATRTNVRAIRQIRAVLEEWAKLPAVDLTQCGDDEAYAFARMLIIAQAATKDAAIVAQTMVSMANDCLGRLKGEPDASLVLFAGVARNLAARVQARGAKS